MNDEQRKTRINKLRELLKIGADQLDRGEGVPFTKELVRDIQRRGRERLKIQQNSNE
jgi:hypothetical protein